MTKQLQEDPRRDGDLLTAVSIAFAAVREATEALTEVMRLMEERAGVTPAPDRS